MADSEFKLSVTRGIRDIQESVNTNESRQKEMEDAMTNLAEQMRTLHTTQGKIQANVAVIGAEPNQRQNSVIQDSGPYRHNIFHGYSNEDATAWVDRFEANAQMRGYSDGRKAGAFRLNLSGPAETWFQELQTDQKTTYANLRIAFQDRYITGQSKSALQDLLFDRKQAPHESVEAYTAEMRKMFLQLGSPESQRLIFYQRGLRDPIRRTVCLKEPVNLDAAEKAALLAERLGTEVVATVREISTEDAGLRADIQALTRELTAQRQQQPAQNVTNGRTTDARPTCGYCGNIGHVFQACRKRRRDTVTCHNCGGKGHYARECQGSTAQQQPTSSFSYQQQPQQQQQQQPQQQQQQQQQRSGN